MWAVKQNNNNDNFAGGRFVGYSKRVGGVILFMNHHEKKTHRFAVLFTQNPFSNRQILQSICLADFSSFWLNKITQFMRLCNFCNSYHVTPFQLQRGFDKSGTKVMDYMRSYTSLFCGDICQILDCESLSRLMVWRRYLKQWFCRMSFSDVQTGASRDTCNMAWVWYFTLCTIFISVGEYRI